MKVIASSFADAADVAAFAKSHDLAHGDNGVGCWGDVTAQLETPMCALPPEDMVQRWGSIFAARHKMVRVRANEKQCICMLADRMPAKAHIKNGAGIDLNPGAAKVLGLNPPFMVEAEWEWINP